MTSFTTLRRGDTVSVSPKNEADQSGLVVICHGLGDTAEGFVDVAEHLATAMPHLKFILPTAPTQPVTMNMGMPMPSWYDITGLDERANENCAGIDQSQTRVQQILAEEHASTGLPYRRMVLAGFSQGGALSLFTGMQLPSEQRLGGIVVMSGYLPAAAQFQITPGLEDTPIMHCHGEADPMVVVNMAKKEQGYGASEGRGILPSQNVPGSGAFGINRRNSRREGVPAKKSPTGCHLPGHIEGSLGHERQGVESSDSRGWIGKESGRINGKE